MMLSLVFWLRNSIFSIRTWNYCQTICLFIGGQIHVYVIIKSEAYLMYVQPILNYAIFSWSPHSKQNIGNLCKEEQQDLLWATVAIPAV